VSFTRQTDLHNLQNTDHSKMINMRGTCIPHKRIPCHRKDSCQHNQYMTYAWWTLGFMAHALRAWAINLSGKNEDP